MQKRGKRKQAELRVLSSPAIQSPAKSTIPSAISNIINEPYPEYPRPTPEECLFVRDDLMSLHGFPKQFAKYQRKQQNSSKSEPPGGEDDGGSPCPVESVLDGLVSTILSQNTTETNSQRAFASLKSAFPNWEDVLGAESKCIEDAIRCGGLAPTKASCIKNMLNCLLERKGKLCLEYLRDLSIDEIKSELSHFKGIGPKTVACVLMFNLQLDDFPVDTHIFHIAKAIGWVPPVSDTQKTYLHLNQRIPNELKFDLNCLLYTHGKVCQNCTKKGSKQKKKVANVDSCPLLHYCKTQNENETIK
ncbi:hypothetical protein LguiB_022805 [Lonicera macranthoides]